MHIEQLDLSDLAFYVRESREISNRILLDADEALFGGGKITVPKEAYLKLVRMLSKANDEVDGLYADQVDALKDRIAARDADTEAQYDEYLARGDSSDN